ncbi:hypothetical protein N0V88_007312 [Collariella sp. IMI 366227]|nr:hypothetical protein N0V88_007312 [Collariella sp. IMI 366227]
MGATDSKVKDDLSIINHPAKRLPGPSLVHELVKSGSKNGQRAIDFLAADGTRTSLSYSEFHHASDTLAARISALAGPHDKSKPFVVPVLIPQCPDLYIALLAILKAGGAFCPMNLDVPLERAKFILDDVSAKVIITTSSLSSKLPPGSHSLLLIDFHPSPEHPSPTKHYSKAIPTDLAYIMYTSGSTGTPKGVCISHLSATQSLLAHDRHIPPFTRFLQFAAPTFDVSVFEIFFPLFRGQTLVCCARQAMLNDLPGVINSMGVDACELTPSVAGLADGYLNRPEQTAAAFIDTRYGRLYRTGDKAKMLLDGTLECLGRIGDGQVKLRGQRMELGEVEHAALRTPGCHSAVAAVVDSTLVLFCAVDGTGEMADVVLESCRQWLPGFMLPGDIVVVDSFPRLASGKVDRKRLVAEYRKRHKGSSTKMA